MDDVAWRVQLEFSSLKDEERFLEWWEATTHAGTYADTPSGEGPVTYFYFADKGSADALALAMRQELSRLSIVPPAIGVHRWNREELRWDDEPLETDDDDDGVRVSRDEYRWKSREWGAKDSQRDGAEAELRPGGSNWFEGLIEGLIRSPWP